MKLIFADEAWEDYLFWQKQDRAVLKRINALIAACQRDPCSGIGKPEPLKQALAGFWSRRTTEEHRLVYEVDDGSLLIAQLRCHYGVSPKRALPAVWPQGRQALVTCRKATANRSDSGDCAT